MQKPTRPAGQQEDVGNAQQMGHMRRGVKRMMMRGLAKRMMRKGLAKGMMMRGLAKRMMRRGLAKGMMGMMMRRGVKVMGMRKRFVNEPWKLVKNKVGDCECTEDARGRLILGHYATFKDCEDEQKKC